MLLFDSHYFVNGLWDSFFFFFERDNPVSFELLSKNWYDHSDLPYGVSSRSHCVFYACLYV